jgi:hypothetical protein
MLLELEACSLQSPMTDHACTTGTDSARSNGVSSTAHQTKFGDCPTHFDDHLSGFIDGPTTAESASTALHPLHAIEV